MSFDDGQFDAIACIHVLEHVPDDGAAISEMYRVLRDGGWALITVPLNLNGPTDEDPSIVDPDERLDRFGERSHVRLYGRDVVARIEKAGFVVSMDDPNEIDPQVRARYGLRTDEYILMSHKPER